MNELIEGSAGDKKSWRQNKKFHNSECCNQTAWIKIFYSILDQMSL
jgi:hypothetical protein